MRFAVLAIFLILAQNASAQTCQELLKEAEDNWWNVKKVANLVKEMVKKNCGEEFVNAPTADTCNALAEIMIEETEGQEDPILKVTAIRELDANEKSRMEKRIRNFYLRTLRYDPGNQLDYPVPGATRILDCMGVAVFGSGKWDSQFYLDRYEDGDELWGFKALSER